jgi:hypothetical protein
MIFPVVTKTMDLVALSVKERQKAAVAREKVADEVLLNLKIIEASLRKTKGLPRTDQERKEVFRLVGRLRTIGFTKVTDGDIPLSQIFDKPLRFPAPRSLGEEKAMKRYLSWISRDKTTADLLRRVYIRIGILQQLAESETGRADLRYLAFMLRVLSDSLRS